jgi:stage V sporulation protein SpoVS
MRDFMSLAEVADLASRARDPRLVVGPLRAALRAAKEDFIAFEAASAAELVKTYRVRRQYVTATSPDVCGLDAFIDALEARGDERLLLGGVERAGWHCTVLMDEKQSEFIASVAVGGRASGG